MCGITGWLAGPEGHPADAPARMEQALQALRRRGPDYQQYQRLGGLLLGHTRLSILDLSPQAHQPMQDVTGRYCIAFNGEIFNHATLRAELQQAGVQFRSRADTEVLLQLLIHEGISCLNRLNGFFSFAFFDQATETLLLARDRYGVKPLVYHDGPEGLRFGSEIKALLALGMPPALEMASLQSYLQLNYLPPDRSMLAGVEKLPPGHYLQATRTERRQQAWYRWPTAVASAAALPYDAAQAQLRTLMDEAVQLRLLADVPVGVFLSGGIDSSVIASLAVRHTRHLHTFSMSFDDPLYDETVYAQAVARRIGSEHTVFRVTYDALSEAIDPVLAYLDEPFADASALNFYLLSEQTRDRVTVALSGDGADELFGGYSKHQGEYLARHAGIGGALLRMSAPLLQNIPAHRNGTLARRIWQLQKLARGLHLGPAYRYLAWCRVADPVQVQALLLSQHYDADTAGLDRFAAGIAADPHSFNRVLEADMQLVLPGDMLQKVDAMSMAHGLEVRTPFLDYRVVEFALGLPSDYKVTRHMRKRIVQDAFRSQLPPELYNRPKQGFEVPLAGWLAGPLRPRVEQLLLDEARIRAQGLFRPEALRRLYQAVLQGRNGKEDWTLWALLVFQTWYTRHWGTASVPLA